MFMQTMVRQMGRQLVSNQMNRCLNIETNVKTNECPKRLIHKSVVNQEMMPHKSGAYEGDGKTTVTVINKDSSGYLLVDAYSAQGFRLSNGMLALGPIALFPSTILQWDVRSADDINEKSLSLFYLMEPKLEVLVIGVGDDNVKVDPQLRLFLSSKKINCEVLSTKHAVTTYNFLNTDHRVCAGAFIPPTCVGADIDMDGFIQNRKALFLSETPWYQ